MVAAVLVVINIAIAATLGFDSDVLDLLPRNEPIVDTFRSTLEDFGGVDLLLVLVEVPEGRAVDPYEEFVEELALDLEELPQLEYVDYKIGDIEELIRSYFPDAFLFLDEEGRRLFEEKLSDEAVRQRVAEIRRVLTTPQAVIAKALIRLDPLGLADLFLDRLSSTRGALRVDLNSGFFLSSDRRLLLLMAKPLRPAQEIDFTQELIAAVDERVASTLLKWPEISGPEPLPTPTVELGGNYMTALEDAAYIRRDVVVNVVTSMLGVLLLFLFAFRRLGVLLYAFIPLFTGLVLAFGFTGLTVGSLNAVSAGMAALLVGLGVDFVIVSYGRYVEERNRGRRIAGALRVMCGSSGRAVLVGGVTSAATFFAFTGTDFVGLRQMGWLTGTGILFCMAAVMLLLPSMLAWSEDHHSRRGRGYPRLYLHGFGSARLVKISMRYPGVVLAIGVILTGALGWLALRLQFEDSIREMRPQGTRAAGIEQKMADHFGSGFDFMMLVLRAETLEEVLELTEKAGAAAAPLTGTNEILRFDSITSILPTRGRQQETLDWLARQRQGYLAPGRLETVFAEAATAEGLRAAGFEDGLALLAEAASVVAPISLGDLSKDDSSRRLLERYVRKSEEGWTSIVYLYPPARIWKREPPPSARKLAEDLGPQVELSGVNVVSEFMRKTVKRDALIAAVVGLVLVSLLLWIDFRRLLDTLLALGPLIVGLVWMLGGMVLVGIPMNFFNIFVSTMIIGIGVDYGIHMMHRYRENREAEHAVLEAGLVETGKAIVLAAASTMIGFGSMSLSSYPGLQSIGYVAILGASSTALVAITLLPAYLSIRLRRWERAEGLQSR